MFEINQFLVIITHLPMHKINRTAFNITSLSIQQFTCQGNFFDVILSIAVVPLRKASWSPKIMVVQ